MRVTSLEVCGRSYDFFIFWQMHLFKDYEYY